MTCVEGMGRLRRGAGMETRAHTGTRKIVGREGWMCGDGGCVEGGGGLR